MSTVTLLTAKWCHLCPSAKELWKELKKEYEFDFEEVDVESERGRKLIEENGIASLPVSFIDGNLVFIGVPSRDEAVLALQNKIVFLGGRKIDREL